MDEVKALTVPAFIGDDSGHNLVVIEAKVLERINELGQQATALSVIHSDEENEAAGKLLKLVTALEKEVEESATAANKPYHDISKLITAAKQKATKPLADIKAMLKNSLQKFLLKRERERADAVAKATNADDIIVKPAEAKTSSTKVTKRLTVVLVDAASVPRAYCVPDLSLIEAAWKRGDITPELHTFFRVEEVVSISSR